MLEPASLPPLAKRSFLKLPVTVDVQTLLAEYNSIPRDAWSTSHWNIHCSSNMLLLRGGSTGTAEDFTTSEVEDRPVLARLPYLRSLIGEGGPFGDTTYAFLFRMKPLGVARPHVDNHHAWLTPFRVHVPITTNDGAFLLADGRAKHFAVGDVWTFDNQSIHAVVNGDSVRTHLIIDVPPNARLEHLVNSASWDPGEPDLASWGRASLPEALPSLAVAASEPLTPVEKARLRLDPEGFASRISRLRPAGRLSRLRAGDVVVAVNGVTECAVARTATDYVQLRHHPGEVLALRVLREGRELELPLRLFANPVPERVRRAFWRFAGTAKKYAGG
jgi:hypothetical protein